jgi:hypothetical protein
VTGAGGSARDGVLLALVLLAVAFVAWGSEWAGLAYEPAAIAESDFQLHWAAGQVLAAGGDPYDSASVDAIGAPTGRAFTPFCAANPLIVRLFGLADRDDFPGAYRAWRDVNLGLLALAIAALALAVRRAGAPSMIAALSLALAALALDDGTWMAHYFNQTNAVTLLAVSGALLAAQSGRPATEGVLLAVATVAKTSPALLLLVALLAGRRRTVLVAGLTLLVLGLVSVAWNGAPVHFAYLDTLRTRLGYAAFVAPGEFNNSLHDWNLAPNGLLSRAADAAGWPMSLARTGAWAVTLTVLALLARALRAGSGHPRSPASPRENAFRLMALYALGVSAGFLTSSVTWSPHLSLAALPFAWLALAAARRESGPGPEPGPEREWGRVVRGALLVGACFVLFVPLGTFAQDAHLVLDVRLKAAALVVLYALVLSELGRERARAPASVAQRT